MSGANLGNGSKYTLGAQVIGREGGDFLTIGNAWASFVIVREDDNETVFGVTMMNSTGARAVHFPTLHDALAYVYAELVEYQLGRVS